MLSPFCCMVSYQLGATFRVPEIGLPICGKRFGSWKCLETKGNRPSRAHCACIHSFRVFSSYDQRSLRLHSRRRWPKLDPCLMLSTYPPCKCGSPRPPASKVPLDSVSEEMGQGEPASWASTFSLKGLPALALTLSAVFGGQPAYADFKPSVLAEVGAQMEVTSSSVPSVEAILAKQLARRFREMSDVELVDILRQLLEASRSSPGSKNAVDVGIDPQDMVIQKLGGQVDTKSPERIREEVRVPEIRGTDTKTEKRGSDRNTFSGTQPANGQSSKETDKSTSGRAPLPWAEEANEQVDKRVNIRNDDRAQVTETQGQELPMDRTPAEETTVAGRLSETQQTRGGGNAVFKVQQRPEIDPGNASGTSKLSASDKAGETSASEPSSSKPDRNTGEGSGDDENVTELLWAEWSRRAAGQAVQEPQTSGNSSNVADLWQSGQTYSGTMGMKVAAFTALVFDRYKVLSIGTIWSLFLVLAFYLGRFRASLRKYVSNGKEDYIRDQDNQNLPISSFGEMTRGDLGQVSKSSSKSSAVMDDSGLARVPRLKESMPKSKRAIDAGIGEDNYERRTLPVEEQRSIKTDQIQKEKRQKRPSGEGFLSETQETLARRIPVTSDQSPLGSFSGASGRLAQEVEYPSDTLSNRARGGPTPSVGSGSDADDVFDSELEQMKDQQREEDASAQRDQDKQNLPSLSSGEMTRGDLGQVSASSSKDSEVIQDSGLARVPPLKELKPKSKRALKRALEPDVGEESYETRTLLMEEQPSIKSNQIQQEKWWKRPSGEGFLSETDETLARSIPVTSDQSPLRSGSGASKRLAQEVNYPSDTLSNRARRGPTASLGSRSDADDVFDSELEQMKGQQSGEEASAERDQDKQNLPIVSLGEMTRGDLGQVSASSSKDSEVIQDSGLARVPPLKECMPKSKRALDADTGEDSHETMTLLMEEQPSIKSNQIQQEKWWKRPSGEGFLSETDETLARSIPVTSDQSPLRSGSGASKRLAQEVNYPSDTLSNRARRGPTASLGSRSDADDVFDSELEQMKGQQSGEEASAERDQDKQNLPIVSLGEMTRGDLGQVSASSSKDSEVIQDSGLARVPPLKECMPKSKRALDADTGEDSHETMTLLMEEQPSIKSNQIQQEKWWKRPSGEGLLSEPEETLARSILVTSDQSPLRSGSGPSGRLAEEVNYPSDTAGNKARGGLTPSMGSGSVADDVIDSELEHSKNPQSREVDFVELMKKLYPAMVAVTSLKVSSRELPAVGTQSQPGRLEGQRQPDIAGPEAEVTSDHYATGEESDEGMPSTSDQEYTSSISEHVFGTSNGRNLAHDRVTSAAPFEQVTEKGGSNSNSRSGVTSMRQIPVIHHEMETHDDGETTTSRRCVQTDLDFTDELRHRLEDHASAEQDGAVNGSCREGEEDAAARQSRPELDSFVHNHVMWVRDPDGVFIQQAGSKEERANSRVRGSSRVPQDRPESSSSRAERSSDLPSTGGSKKSKKGSRNGFDYRQLVINLRETVGERQEELSSSKTKRTAASIRQQRWPLRYGSEQEKVSQ